LVTIEHKDSGRLAILTLQRPDQRNALNRELVSRLTELISGYAEDNVCRVIILTGSGNTFSAGADLKALEDMQSATFNENREDSKALARLFSTIRRSPKPVIARVNGHAIAGGLGLVTSCDFSICVEEARLGFTEVRIGMVPAIVMVLLKRRLGDLALRNLLLRGHLVSAAEAEDIGLINMAVSSTLLDEKVFELARELASLTSPHAVSATKRMMAEMEEMNWTEALDYAVTENARARETADCRAGISAFLDKTDPPWKISKD
jgi:methylglutaconyl-CoA hydratase